MRSWNMHRLSLLALLASAALALPALTGCALLPSRSGETLAPEAPRAAAPDTDSGDLEEVAQPRWRLFRFGGKDAAAQPQPEAAPASSSTQAAPSEELPSGTTPYRLRPGDALRIVVGSIPRELAVDNVVDERGMVTLDYLGRVRAEGLTSSELEETVQKAYIDGQIYRSPTVKVLIASRNYYVRGEVRRPGIFPLTGSVTLSQAIAAAGGYTEFANPRRVSLNRGGTNRNVNLRDIERNPELDEPLEAGDVIVVGRGIW